MTPEIAFVTIGQSGRPGIGNDVLAMLPAGVRVTVTGALDDLTTEDIAAARPEDGGDTLFTRLRDGTPVAVSHKTVTTGVNRRLAELEARGISFALLLCTGEFHGLKFGGSLLQPSRALDAMVHSVFTKGRMGVHVPLAEQVDSLPRKWTGEGVEVFAAALRPESDETAIDAAVARLAEQSPDIIVMDCMGYTSADKARVRHGHDGPVILAASAVGRVMGELIE